MEEKFRAAIDHVKQSEIPKKTWLGRTLPGEGGGINGKTYKILVATQLDLRVLRLGAQAP